MLLKIQQVCAAVTRGGDTVLMTLVHNTKCMAALEKAGSSKSNTSTASQGQIPVPNPFQGPIPVPKCITGPVPVPNSLPPSLVSLSEMIQDCRRSLQHQTDAESTSDSPSGLQRVDHGNKADSSPLTSKPSSSLLPPTLAGPKPVKPDPKTGLPLKNLCVDDASEKVSVDFAELPQVLSLLKNKDRVFAEFAASQGRDHSISPLNFDLLTSVFRGGGPAGKSSGEGVKKKQERQRNLGTEFGDVAAASGDPASQSDTPIPGTGLRLAQYTLENVPESVRFVQQMQHNQSSGRLLELFSSAKKTLSSSSKSSQDGGDEEGDGMLVGLSVNPDHTGLHPG